MLQLLPARVRSAEDRATACHCRVSPPVQDHVYNTNNSSPLPLPTASYTFSPTSVFRPLNRYRLPLTFFNLLRSSSSADPRRSRSTSVSDLLSYSHHEVPQRCICFGRCACCARPKCVHHVPSGWRHCLCWIQHHCHGLSPGAVTRCFSCERRLLIYVFFPNRPPYHLPPRLPSSSRLHPARTTRTRSRFPTTPLRPAPLRRCPLPPAT